MPNLPDTSLYTKESDAYAAGGLHLEPVVPMKKWKLLYDGKMRYTQCVWNSTDSFLWACALLQLLWLLTSTILEALLGLNKKMKH